MRFLLRRNILKMAFGLYTLGILLLVALPINGEDQLMGSLNHNYVLRIRYDYLFHALLFIPWVLLGGLGWEILQKSRAKIVSLFFLGLCFAIFCEYLQRLLPYRTFNINDLVSNSLGVLLGGMLLWGLYRYGGVLGGTSFHNNKLS